jgi:signal transduction histidine kinase
VLIHNVPWLRDAAPTVIAVLCAALAALAILRWVRRPALRRRATAPAVLGGALTAACGAADEWEAQCVALALTAAAIGVQAWQARALRGRIAELVLSTLPSAEELRDALARTLGDPGLTIVYPGSPPPSGAVTEVKRGSEIVAVLGHAPSLAPERLATAARGAGPALRHASARARARHELAELRASRARVIEVADEARRRAERDLHDGTQQRLIALSFALAQHPSAARASAELQRALDDLRRLAHGIHPASLTDGGLAAALGELKERSRVPMRVRSVPEQRAPAAVEAALYRLVLDSVECAERYGDGGAVAVAIERAGAMLALPGVPRAAAVLGLEHAADRIAALDGTLTISDERVEARLPCES